MVKFSAFAYTVASGTALFTLPNNAEIIGWTLNVTTAFNAATTNTLDIGIAGTQQQFAATLALGVAGQFVVGFVPSQLFTRLPGSQTVTVRYNQTGAAASAGAATLMCEYIIR
jgi:hypothetical protein